jgi:hypothetical protein
LEPQDFENDEQRDEIVKTLIQDSEARFKYQHVADEHPSGQMCLTKFWYRHSTGRRETHTASDSTAIDKNLDIEDKKWNAIEDANKPDAVRIKVENPGFHIMKDQTTVLKSALISLEKQDGLGKGIGAVLKQKAAKDAGFSKPAEDCQAILD